jgi:hypothetical protein
LTYKLTPDFFYYENIKTGIFDFIPFFGIS